MLVRDAREDKGKREMIYDQEYHFQMIRIIMHAL